MKPFLHDDVEGEYKNLCGGEVKRERFKATKEHRSFHSFHWTLDFIIFLYLKRLRDHLGNTFVEWKCFGLLKRGTAQKYAYL